MTAIYNDGYPCEHNETIEIMKARITYIRDHQVPMTTSLHREICDFLDSLKLADTEEE